MTVPGRAVPAINEPSRSSSIPPIRPARASRRAQHPCPTGPRRVSSCLIVLEDSSTSDGRVWEGADRMFTLTGGERSRFCDGVTRRDFLRVGGLALGGIGLPQLLRAEAQA